MVPPLAADPPASADVVSVSTDVGTLLAHAHDRYITPMLMNDGRWEPAEGLWLRSAVAAGSAVVDCGANIGYFTLLASELAGPSGVVVAIEPERSNLRLLRANVWRNRADNVWIVPAAAGDDRGLLSLRLSADNTGDHQIHLEAEPGDALVPVVALDELFDGIQIDVIKIDTQGADHLVVGGLQRSIASHRGLRLLIEFWLDGMASRHIEPLAVLHHYRSLGRPLGVLREDGSVAYLSDVEIIAAAEAWEGRWVNLVLGESK